MYRIVDEYGKKGIDVIREDGTKEFFPEPKIAIFSKLPRSVDLDKENIPEFERNEHYRISQIYYFYCKLKDLSWKEGKSISEIEAKLEKEIALRLEREFRWLYYQQFKNKDRE